MAKKYKHWCDPYHTPKQTNFDTGDLAYKIVKTLTEWLMHDSSIVPNMTKEQVELIIERTKKIFEIAEEIECLVIEANSIYAVYNCDYVERRNLFRKARGYCFHITVRLRHIVDYVYKDINIDKYLQLEDQISHLANMIKNIMVKDDKRRKEKAKE